MARPQKVPYHPVTTVMAAKALALSGMNREEIAKALGVSNATFSTWLNEHPDFREAFRYWRQQADDRVEEKLYERALAGDMAAIRFWLTNRRPEDWSERARITHEGKVDAILQVISGVPERGEVIDLLPEPEDPTDGLA